MTQSLQMSPSGHSHFSQNGHLNSVHPRATASSLLIPSNRIVRIFAPAGKW
jgi:hypothetical protein